MEWCNPLAICLVSSGSRGDRLLFRYPYETEEAKEVTLQAKPVKNPYAVRIEEDYKNTRYTDKVLGNFLAIKFELCGRKFEVKIDDIIFVGYPMVLHHGNIKRDTTKTSFNVVFALRSSSDESLIASYQDLAKQIALALRHEEKRCDFLNNQKAQMMAIKDEVATMTEDSLESPFRLILQKCQLAKQLKAIYDDLCHCGVVQVYINKWVHVNFCLPHKLHNLHLPKDSNTFIQPEAIKKCIAALRPYHAVMLLVDDTQLLDSLPPDSSPALTRLIRVATPLKSLQTLASDADLSLGQVSQLVTHLVYWGKAIIIYPLCESNVYTISPSTNTYVNAWLVEKFVETFPGRSLHAVLADFSMPTPLIEHKDVHGLPQQQAQQVQMVMWMLQHRLLMQLHTYVFLIPSVETLITTPAITCSTTNNSDKRDTVFLLSPDESQDSQKFSGISDTHSVTSEGSSEQGGFGTVSSMSTKSPSVEVTSNGAVITEEVRNQWRLRDSLLSSLSPQQQQCVIRIPASNNPEDLKLFARLCPYFNGKHHLEEIMYYENVRRSQLLTLLDKFRVVLITCQHEDPGTSCWLK